MSEAQRYWVASDCATVVENGLPIDYERNVHDTYVLASDYDALAAKLAAAERDAARYRHLRSLRGLTVTFRDHVRFKTSSGNKLIEVRTIGEYDLDAALDAMGLVFHVPADKTLGAIQDARQRWLDAERDAARYLCMRDMDDSDLLRMFASGKAHWDATLDAAMAPRSDVEGEQS